MEWNGIVWDWIGMEWIDIGINYRSRNWKLC